MVMFHKNHIIQRRIQDFPLGRRGGTLVGGADPQRVRFSVKMCVGRHPPFTNKIQFNWKCEQRTGLSVVPNDPYIGRSTAHNHNTGKTHAKRFQMEHPFQRGPNSYI